MYSENPEAIIEKIAAQFPNLHVYGCYDVSVSESVCIHKKLKNFNVKDIEAYIEVFVLPDSEEEPEYMVNFDYGDEGFVAIKKINETQFLYMASSYNIFPYLSLYLKNLNALANSITPSDILIQTQPEKKKVAPLVQDDQLLAAKKIQSLVLSDQSDLDPYFSSHYLYYEPKDVIGGDFYTYLSFGDVVYLAIVDCTGHSIEGALASMAVSSIINQVIHDANVNPLIAIEEVHQKIEKYNEARQLHDSYGLGAEMALVRYDKNTCSANIASSGIQLSHLKGGLQEPLKVKKNIFSVGNFFSQELVLDQGDSLIVFSDGLPDQYDRNDKKKMGKSGLRKLIDAAGIDSVDMTNNFEMTLSDWKGKTGQLDDQTLLVVTV